MNVPDDWGMYYRACSRGHRFHESEGGCHECAEHDGDLADKVAELHRRAEEHLRNGRGGAALKLLEEAHGEVEERRW